MMYAAQWSAVDRVRITLRTAQTSLPVWQLFLASGTPVSCVVG